MILDSIADHDALWRQRVFPADWRNPAPCARYNLAVIGAGPAGLITAIAAAGLGAKVALIERHAMGGDCLNVGCVPSKALLAAAREGRGFEAAFAHLRAVRAAIAEHDSVERYARAGVDVFLGEARFESPQALRVGDVRIAARRFVIATGARADLPPIPGLADSAPLTNETVFDLREQPRRLAILGAGPIGCELAQAFALLGTETHLIEQAPRVLGGDEPDASALVAAGLVRDGVSLHAPAKVERVERTPEGTRLFLAGQKSLGVDALLVAAGRRRNLEALGLEAAGVRFDARDGIAVDARLRTSQPHIHAIGDVASRLQFTHAADAQARIVVRNALFLGRARSDSLIIPRCTYTRPELAHVGATRAELDAAGRAYLPLRVDFRELDRGRTDAVGEGWAEVRVDSRSSRILGATIVADDAGELLAPLLVMMNSRLGLSSLGSIVLPYPTRSEYLRRLADAWNRQRLTPRAAALLRWWLERTR